LKTQDFSETNVAEDGELNQLIKFLEENPEFLIQFLNSQNNENSEFETKTDDDQVIRYRRRNSVFKNIYQQCRLQKRKEKNYCLQVANLYQNVKGFHGL